MILIGRTNKIDGQHTAGNQRWITAALAGVGAHVKQCPQSNLLVLLDYQLNTRADNEGKGDQTQQRINGFCRTPAT